MRSVIDLAQAFGISPVAEGIETVQQLTDLRGLGCDFGQGFLWSPGRNTTELGTLLSDSLQAGQPRAREPCCTMLSVTPTTPRMMPA